MLATFLLNPYTNGIAIFVGTFVGFSEVFLRGKPLPALSATTLKRGAPTEKIVGALIFCLIYASAIAIFLFNGTGEKQYFLAAGAAVQTLANVIARQR